MLAQRRRSLVAELAAARAEVSKALASMRKYSIHAPFDGVVAERAAHVGEVVWTDSMGGGNGNGILTLSSLDQLIIEVDVADTLFHSMDPKAKALVTFDALPGTRLERYVTQILPTVDRNKGTRRIRIEMPSAPAAVRPGMMARVTFEGARLGE